MARARVLVVDDSPTILKVVGQILTRAGFEAVTARDGVAGLELLRRGDPVDLVLLDFIMPRMNGYQFCRALRSDAKHRLLPIVLMSAKGDKIRGQFVSTTGAVDAITKPFDPRALVAVVEGALAKTETGAASRAVPDGQQMPEEDTVAESLRGKGLALGEEARARMRASIEFAQQIANTIVPSLAAVPEQDRGSEAALMAAVARAMTPDVIKSLVTSLRELDHEALGGGDILSGDASAIQIAEVLQMLQAQRQTGVLKVSHGRSAIHVWMRDGLIELVEGRALADEFRIGRYLVEQGVMTKDKLQELIQRIEPGKLFGQLLLEMNLLAEPELRKALRRQSSELIYEALRWPGGRFAFRKETPKPAADGAHLGLGVTDLLLEGCRRVDEWRLMESRINFDQVVVIDPTGHESLDEDKLTRVEKLIFESIDGQRTIGEVIKEAHVGSFDGIKIIYSFLESRLVRAKAA